MPNKIENRNYLPIQIVGIFVVAFLFSFSSINAQDGLNHKASQEEVENIGYTSVSFISKETALITSNDGGWYILDLNSNEIVNAPVPQSATQVWFSNEKWVFTMVKTTMTENGEELYISDGEDPELIEDNAVSTEVKNESITYIKDQANSEKSLSLVQYDMDTSEKKHITLPQREGDEITSLMKIFYINSRYVAYLTEREKSDDSVCISSLSNYDENGCLSFGNLEVIDIAVWNQNVYAAVADFKTGERLDTVYLIENLLSDPDNLQVSVYYQPGTRSGRIKSLYTFGNVNIQREDGTLVIDVNHLIPYWNNPDVSEDSSLVLYEKDGKIYTYDYEGNPTCHTC
jgi:hypothetical protein